MKLSGLVSIVAAAAPAFAQYSTAPNATAPGPDEDGKYEISAEGIRGLFIPYGASIANLFINDTNGIERDIVLGFDNASYYEIDPLHPHLGGVPGRSNGHNWDETDSNDWQVAMPTASRTAPLSLTASSTRSHQTRTTCRTLYTVDPTAGTTYVSKSKYLSTAKSNIWTA